MSVGQAMAMAMVAVTAEAESALRRGRGWSIDRTIAELSPILRRSLDSYVRLVGAFR